MEQKRKLSAYLEEAFRQIERNDIIIDSEYTKSYYIDSEEQFDRDYSKLFKLMKHAKSIFFSENIDIRKILEEKEKYLEGENIPLVSNRNGSYLVNLANVGKKGGYNFYINIKYLKDVNLEGLAKSGEVVSIEITDPADISLDVLKKINQFGVNVGAFYFYDKEGIRYFNSLEDIGNNFEHIIEMAKALKKFDVSMDFPMEELKSYIKEHPEGKEDILIPDSNKTIVNLKKINERDYERTIIPVNLRDLDKIDLEKFKEGDNSFRLVIGSVAELSEQQINELKEKGYPISEICVFDEGNGVRQNFPYDLDMYVQLRRKLEELVEGIDPNLSEGEKFAEVYKRVGKFISYDTPVAYPKTDEEKILSEREATSSRNLVNGLLKGKAVCAGYADILRNALSLVGIEAHYVSGRVHEGDISLEKYEQGKYNQDLTAEVDEKGKRVSLYEGHAWNKVKIDGVWYNVDVTFDNRRLKRGEIPKCCFKTDAEIEKTDKKTRFSGPECVTQKTEKEVARMFGDKNMYIGNTRLLSLNDVLQMIRNEIIETVEDIKDDVKTIRGVIDKFFRKGNNALPPPVLKEANSEPKNNQIPCWDLSNWEIQKVPTANDFLKNYDENESYENEENFKEDDREK